MNALFSVVSLLILLGYNTSQGYECNWFTVSSNEANVFLKPGIPNTEDKCKLAHCETSEGHGCKYHVPTTCPPSCPPGQVLRIEDVCYGQSTCTDICQVLTVDRCLNGGTCVPKGVSFTCNCRPGFEGTICAVDIDECASHPCNTTTSIRCIDGENDYSCQCKPGYTGQYCDSEIDECAESLTHGLIPCEHGGTCIDKLNYFSCSCIPGYTGLHCETDIDECASNPCQNGATCLNKLNRFKCECPDRIYGVLCDTNICHPTPADVVFVLDSSVSMTEKQFQKQLEFVASFAQHVHVGPLDFQISVVTFSFEAEIEFYLNQYTDNTTLVDAVMNITYKPGATFTDKGLRTVVEVFSAGHGIERRINDTLATRFVYLMTDGMSNNKSETKKAAAEVKRVVDTVAVIGIGAQVCHQELISIASDPSLVYSVENFNSLFSVLKRLVHFDCDECVHSAESDVAIFLDSSYTMSHQQFDHSKNAITYLIDTTEIGVNKTQISLSSFDKITTVVFDIGTTENKNNINIEINKIEKSTDATKLPMAKVYEFARNHLLNSTNARPNAKRFLIVFTNGGLACDDVNDLDMEKAALEAAGVKLIVVGSGLDVNTAGLYGMVTDAFNVVFTDEETLANLDVLQAEFVYNKCDLQGE